MKFLLHLALIILLLFCMYHFIMLGITNMWLLRQLSEERIKVCNRGNN